MQTDCDLPVRTGLLFVAVYVVSSHPFENRRGIGIRRLCDDRQPAEQLNIVHGSRAPVDTRDNAQNYRASYRTEKPHDSPAWPTMPPRSNLDEQLP